MNARGFTLIEILVVAAIGGVALFGVASVLNTTMHAKSKQTLRDGLLSTRLNYLDYLTDDAAWMTTANANDFDCVRAGSCSGTPVFSLRDASGAVIHDSTDAEWGYTETGVRCPKYGDEACVFRTRLDFEVACGTCNPILVRIALRVIAMDQTLNLEAYGFRLTRAMPSGPSGPPAGLTFTTTRGRLYNGPPAVPRCPSGARLNGSCTTPGWCWYTSRSYMDSMIFLRTFTNQYLCE